MSFKLNLNPILNEFLSFNWNWNWCFFKLLYLKDAGKENEKRHAGFGRIDVYKLPGPIKIISAFLIASRALGKAGGRDG